MSDRIIFALIGAIVGGLVSGLFIGKHCRKVCDERINDLEAENKQLRARVRKEKEQEMDKKEEELRVKEAYVDTSIQTQRTMAREERHNAAKKAQEIAKENGYSDSEDEEEDDDLDDEEWDDEEVEFDDPFDEDGESIVVKKPEEKKEPSFKMLSQEDYEKDFEFRDSECLMFYQQDQILADAFDDPVANASEIVGGEAMDIASDTEDDYVYVLDEVEDKMYEIEINHEESFYKDILRGGEL